MVPYKWPREPTFSRRMSPEEIADILKCSSNRPLCVPFPEPGGPTRITRAALRSLWRTFEAAADMVDEVVFLVIDRTERRRNTSGVERKPNCRSAQRFEIEGQAIQALTVRTHGRLQIVRFFGGGAGAPTAFLPGFELLREAKEGQHKTSPQVPHPRTPPPELTGGGGIPEEAEVGGRKPNSP
jgi:hypothetical protein